MEYAIIDHSHWKTNLCHYDCESCFLSYVVPCHVYSKIVSKTPLEYTTHLILYGILYIFIHQLLYLQYNLKNSLCPSTEIQNCVLAKVGSCLDNYMIVNSMPSACRILDNVCIYDEYQCINQYEYYNITKFTLLLTTILYGIFLFMNYQARKYIIKTKKLVSSSDCVIVACCSNCALAQEYREL